ncbi:hypothetical protein FX988_00153 [Paraglaciecola mesophila]|uniref:Uncharacterized protein n=1 Tax=Paraglaciecola mesophila TaxID=197222 RepID=A0A857JD38_9ALTE|nr:hypothetical protein [Paraglaciecola mesophila]QHJ09945.1 hypothetical protein FX988_00153 [Paraglaciecola mesophila]
MKKTLFTFGTILVSLTAITAHASVQCATDPTKLSASYTLESSNGVQHRNSELVLYRNGKTVAHHYPQTQITESWYQSPNQQVKPTRFFDSAKRAIEYQPGEKVHGKTETDWNYRNNLISQSLLSQLDLIKETGKGCELTRHYSKTIGDTKISVQWAVEQSLLLEYSWQQDNKKEIWTLAQVTHDAKEVDRFFAQRSHYQTTDFADIGDDHSDPFLTKMVTLGFIEKGASGFYDDKGNALAGGHHH